MVNPLGPDTTAFLRDVEASAKVKKLMAICDEVKDNKRDDGERSKIVIATARP